MQTFPDIRYLERTHGVTWHELVELEPRLAHCCGSLVKRV
jgi:hypothetical protein